MNKELFRSTEYSGKGEQYQQGDPVGSNREFPPYCLQEPLRKSG